jgi:tRNA G18 (ribose-2'-O)-methylase SpoU
MRKLEMHELQRSNAEEFKTSKKIPVVVVLDNVRSAINVGSVFRTSDAFRIQQIVLCGYTPQPPHREINKSALGATESVDWTYFETTTEALEHLKKDGFQIIAIEQTEPKVWLNEFAPQNSEKYAVVLGNEVEGISDEALNLCDLSLEIPQEGTKHSLNISVAAGIVLWHFFKGLR